MSKMLLFRGVKLMDRVSSKLPPIGSFQPLRGNFSAIDLLDQGSLQGELIARSQVPGPCPPGSMTERAGMRQHDHQPWPVFWVRSDDARLVGRMLHWRDPQDRLCSEGVFHLHERRRFGEDGIFAQIFVPEAKFLPGAWTSIASNLGDGSNYFHWMLDNLTRLRVRESLPEPTRILLPQGCHRFIAETIEMLGLQDEVDFPAAKCLQPERFYFCSATSMTGVWNPMGFDWLRQKFASFRASVASGKPVFFTRRGSARVPPDLARIEETFSQHGFDIVDCGMLSVKEQIQLSSQASAIAGLHGAALTNLLWALPGTPILEMFTAGYLNACYEQIAFQGCLDYKAHILSSEADIHALRKWCKAL